MLETILQQLVSSEHPLALIRDPDGILQDETLLASLAKRGRVIDREFDPIALRHEFQRWRLEPGQSLTVITSSSLDRLPYDLWQQGHHVTLALSGFFPHLDYPILRGLRPGQRRKLDQEYAAAKPPRLLSPVETKDYLLRVVFGAVPERLASPAALLLWLDDIHRQTEHMPIDLQERLVAVLRQVPAYADWPLWAILVDADEYRVFVRDAWQREVGHFLGEGRVEYEVLSFAADEALQDTLPRLVRTGTVAPIVVDQNVHLPDWAAPAVAVDRLAGHRRQLDAACEDVRQQLEPAELRWEDWQSLAHRWAELTLLRYDYDFNPTPAQRETVAGLETLLDARFASWLQVYYSSLAGNVLPRPHHVSHVPRFMEYLYDTVHRTALLVLDGMSLADWLLIRETWTQRHPDWDIIDLLVLAQIPSITAVSRQALISGRRPAAFADTITSNHYEARHWANFHQRRFGSTAGAAYELLPDRAAATYPPAVDSQYTGSLCLVSSVIDAMVHGATQGTADVINSVKLWLTDGYSVGTGSSWFEGLIASLLENNYLVTIATDHGHVEALGMGQPQEGVLVETRSKRARLYNNLEFARAVQAQFPETILWENDGLLPAGWQALMPTHRTAFAPAGQRVVSHGGLTIEEMVVPLIVVESG